MMASPAIDIAGKRFGRLLVVAKAPTRPAPARDRAARWVAKCDCGAEKIVAGADLRKGNTLSCGCMQAELARSRNEAKIIDLTGMRFGRLTVIGRSTDIASSGGRAQWNCSCSCGRHVTVRGYALRGGNSQSCGCLRKEQIALHHEYLASLKRQERNTRALEMLGVSYEELIEDLTRFGGHGEAHWRGKYESINSAMVIETMELADECPACGRRFVNLTENHDEYCRMPEYLKEIANG